MNDRDSISAFWNLSLPQFTGASSNLIEEGRLRFIQILWATSTLPSKSSTSRFSARSPCETTKDAGVLEKDRHDLQKLLKWLCCDWRKWMGRAMKFWMGRFWVSYGFGWNLAWVEHFSMETPAAIVVRVDKFKGLKVNPSLVSYPSFLVLCPLFDIVIRIYIKVWAFHFQKQDFRLGTTVLVILHKTAWSFSLIPLLARLLFH